MTIPRHSLLYAAAGLIAVGSLNLAVFAGRDRAGNTPGNTAGSDAGGTPAPSVAAAGPGRVEPLSEEVRVSSQLGGKLQRVLVEEGDSVEKGQTLAILQNDDFQARVASAEAALRLKEAEARRVTNGARDQERREAAATVREAEAVLESTNADHGRRRELYQQAVISHEEMDRADQQLRVAQARLEAARQHAALIDADAREEDEARARSDVALAKAQLAEARAMYEKTCIRSPIAGVVLRKHLKTGESVSTQFDSPIVTLADRSVIRVRVDIDETDVGKISVGQPAYVTADAFGTRRFTGHVVRLGQLLGKKNVRTDQPTERVDQKILETLIQLDDGRELPIGLRVQAFIR
jgi:HlyD family secretion protein